MMEHTSQYCYDIYLSSIAILAPMLVVNPVFASAIISKKNTLHCVHYVYIRLFCKTFSYNVLRIL